MRTIAKLPEPVSLTEYRASPGATYEDYPDKTALRTHLVREQRGLCCYCLSRIRNEYRAMKIEHWHCREDYSGEQLDYSNLLGVCTGNEGKALREQHCDTRKRNKVLSRNPANPAHTVEAVLRFEGGGRLVSTDPVFDQEINGVLNLNLAFLRNNRKAVLDAFLGALPRAGEIKRSRLEDWLREWNGDSGAGDLPEFCQVVVYWLRKRLARA